MDVKPATFLIGVSLMDSFLSVVWELGRGPVEGFKFDVRPIIAAVLIPRGWKGARRLP